MCNTVKPALVDTRGTLPNSGIAPHSLKILLFSNLLIYHSGWFYLLGVLRPVKYNQLINQEPKNPVEKKNREVTVKSSLGKTMGENDTRDYNEF